MSIDDALLMNEPRTGRNARVRRRLEKALVGNSARYVADAARRAMPIALGVLAATTLSTVLDAFVDAFVAPAVQLALFRSVGVREETLESVTFEICGVPFAIGRFFAAVLDAFATLSAIGVVARLFSGRLPRFARCVACLSYIDIDAKVCPCCARDQRGCGSGDGGDGRASRRAKDLRCWRERFDADTDDTDDDTDDTDDDTDDDTRAGRPQRRVWEGLER